MRTIEVDAFETWREASRTLLREGWAPRTVTWRSPDHPQSALVLEDGGAPDASKGVAEPRVAKDFMPLARLVAHHRDPKRWGLLYRLLWRLTHGEPQLMSDAVEPEVRAARAMAKEVRRDAHKMRAFVRFRRLDGPDGEHFVAWHRPDHLIVPWVAPFFQDRFASMRWTILSPDCSVSWDLEKLTFFEGVPRSEAPSADELESLWKTYYRSIFNPARIKLRAMQAEMPAKHWPTMPETAIIGELLREAPERVREMIAHRPVTAERFVPADAGLDLIRSALPRCQACGLCDAAHGPVAGEGPARARLVIVGEQPGCREDEAGRPFVGPAGQLLDEAMAEANIRRDHVYLTNAVKAFKHEPGAGGSRLHKKPTLYDLEVCKPWLSAELRAIAPRVVVGLGGTAALALTGRKVAITKERGLHRTPFAEHGVMTFHPAAILRATDPAARRHRFDMLVQDLRHAATHAESVV